MFSRRSEPYIIPEYSLTGDLLAYLTCGLQYRYYNRAALPPSRPVQLWFGEFLHSVMEESFRIWRQNPEEHPFPWPWEEKIRPIELEIHKRLAVRGLNPPPQLFCPYPAGYKDRGLCPDPKHPHKLLASQRTEAAINIWGPHLFPLITEAEVRLRGTRPMPPLARRGKALRLLRRDGHCRRHRLRYFAGSRRKQFNPALSRRRDRRGWGGV
ncbi:hypothetical protein [Desulfothermobacter acidiphilus]|uniref:hypothetical protein n=1 Tax=Desulfothermobacter acidiphilus TaxID=1938353 RepID=UPI003F8C806E